jgi:hypothetical protein
MALLKFYIDDARSKTTEQPKVMQATWRGTFNRLTYQLTLLDIVISQSVVQSKLAQLNH